jgi:hemolysin III
MNWLDVREPVSAWTHFAWLVLSIPATWVLWRRAAAGSHGSALKRTGVLIFGFTLAFCFAGSFLFHAVPPRLARPFNTMDHIGIYLLIAGTVTPIALIAMRGRWRIALLGGIWALALSGISLRLAVRLPVGMLTVGYVVMGWVGCATWFELSRHLPAARIRPLWAGGLIYTAGAVLNSLHWPDVYPGLVGAHEVFHLFVMAGSACHYWFILTAIVPFHCVPVAVALREARSAALEVPASAIAEPAIAPG